MACEHPWMAVCDSTTEVKPDGGEIRRGRCGKCGAPLTKETMGRPTAEGTRPLRYSLPVDEALKPSIA